MKSETHMRIVAWTFLILGLGGILTGGLLAVAEWFQMQDVSGSIAEVFHLFGFVVSVLLCITSLLYLRIAVMYFQTVAGTLFFPTRASTIVVMILGFPCSTLLGAYALYARKQHMKNLGNNEQEC